MVNRLSNDMQGVLTINRMKTEVEPEVTIRVHDDELVKFKPISVIHQLSMMRCLDPLQQQLTMVTYSYSKELMSEEIRHRQSSCLRHDTGKAPV